MKGASEGKEWAASFAALEQQVAGIENDHRDLKELVQGTDRKIDRVAVELGRQITDGLGRLTDRLDERNRTPWAVIVAGIGVGVTLCVAIGGLAYAPVWNSIGDLKAEAKDARAAIVPRVEYEQRWRMQDRDLARANDDIRELRRDISGVSGRIERLQGLAGVRP